MFLLCEVVCNVFKGWLVNWMILRVCWMCWLLLGVSCVLVFGLRCVSLVCIVG